MDAREPWTAGRARGSLASLLGILLLACACSDGAALRSPERVVLVSIDTLRADAVGAYGRTSSRTAALDRLARDGVRFTNAISPAPLTLPSHTSLLTALDPPHHGVRDNATFSLPEEIPTLAERLAEAGFETAAFVGAMVLDRQYGLARGFDLYDDDLGVPTAGEFSGIPERTADAVVGAALDWVASAPDRFFLWIHLYDPHNPYRAPLWKMQPDDGARYIAEVEFADAQLALLLDAVRARWPGDDTLYVATSDHGESLGQHGEATHSLGIYDATQHIPLLAAGVGLPRGRTVDAVVRLVDVAPTILALAGLEPFPGAQGRSLLPLIRGDDHGERVAYLETLATQLGHGWSPLLGVRTKRFKFIRAPRPELYDLQADPGETRNVHSERPEVAEDMDRRLETQLAGARRVRRQIVASDEEVRLLASLGYVARTIDHGEAELGRVGGPDPKDQLALRERLQPVALLLAEGNVDAAAARLERIETRERDAAVDRLAAKIHLARADHTELERVARRIVERDPMDQDGLRLLGEALEGQGRLDEAIEALRAAVRLNPQRGWSLVTLGRVLERRGDVAGAEHFYERSVAARASSNEGVWRLAALRIEAGREADAARLLDPLAPGVLRDPPVAARLARAEERAGRPRDALDRLDRALRTHPDSAVLRSTREEIERGVSSLQ